MPIRLKILAAFALLAALTGTIVQAAGGPELKAQIVRPDSTHGIEGLSFPADDVPIQVDSQGPYVELNGTYTGKARSLVFMNKVLPLDKNGEVVIKTRLVDQITPVLLASVDPFGKITQETIQVRSLVPYAELRARFISEGHRPFYLTAGAGFSYLRYRETGVVDYNSISLTPKVSLGYRFGTTPWELGLSGYMTAFALSKNQPSLARFLGINGRVGYRFMGIKAPWSLALLAGWYYTTMFVQNDAFGFRNMQGPQLFPTASYALNGRDSISGYLKFSPVTDGFSPLSLSNRELAIGSAFSRKIAHGRSVSASLDLATFSLTIRGRPITSSSVTLGASYGF